MEAGALRTVHPPSLPHEILWCLHFADVNQNLREARRDTNAPGHIQYCQCSSLQPLQHQALWKQLISSICCRFYRNDHLFIIPLQAKDEYKMTLQCKIQLVYYSKILESIPAECLNHLSLFLSMQRSIGSLLSVSWIPELVALALMQSPTTLQRQLFENMYIVLLH